MKILYDHQMFSRQKYGGITKYFCELIKHLPQYSDYELSLLFTYNQHLKDNYKVFKKPYFPIPKHESSLRGHLKAKTYYINELYSKKKIRRGSFDIFHPTYFDPYFLQLIEKPYIVTVHDLIVFNYPNVLKKEQQMEDMKKIVTNANRIIAISQHTKKEIIETLGISSDKIDVIYHGFTPIKNNKSDNPYGRYILFVGARLGYKNFKSLAIAFQKLVQSDRELKLVCVGPSFEKFEIEQLKKLNLLNNILNLGVNEEELNHLYSRALAFVNPSVYEGFGMSILEAFANNCPVCLSNTTCFPEIAADAAMYFDPYNSDSLAEAISKVIYDSATSENLKQLANQRLNFFSWEKCAWETYCSYHKTSQ